MKIVSGRKYNNDVHDVGDDSVRFVAEDGRTMFEVSCGDDGRSIEVRGIEVCKVSGKLYSEGLEIRPQVSNCITIRARLYDDSH